MKNKPLISVIMTVFNAEKYLAASIESIMQQSFSDWEFLVIDDGSTDHSVSIAQGYAKKDERIRVITNITNKGQTACLNQALLEAQGDLIARQDADDLSHPLRFEKQVKRFHREPELMLLGTAGFIINEKNQRVALLDVPLTHELICWSSSMLNPLLHTSVMFQKKIINEIFGVGGYDESFRIAQDYDFWTRIMAHHQVANLSERLVSYRHLESSLSKKGRSTAFEEAAAISQRVELMALGRSLKAEERAVITSFREGKIEASQRKIFWELLRALSVSVKKNEELTRKDFAHLFAAYHFKFAGSFADQPLVIIAEIMDAFFTAPLFTMRWMWERIFLLLNSASGPF